MTMQVDGRPLDPIKGDRFECLEQIRDDLEQIDLRASRRDLDALLRHYPAPSTPPVLLRMSEDLARGDSVAALSKVVDVKEEQLRLPAVPLSADEQWVAQRAAELEASIDGGCRSFLQGTPSN